jgi:hypothetical protein
MLNKDHNSEGLQVDGHYNRDHSRLAREKFWIRQLQTRRRKGLSTIVDANATVDIPYLPEKLPHEYKMEFAWESHGILAYFDKKI